MDINIDQSGKIEEPRDTVISFSNNEQFTVMIPLEVKKRLLQNLKPKRNRIYKVFAIGVYHCIKDYLNSDRKIIIDDEYRKHGNDIKTFLLLKIRKKYPLFNSKLIIIKSIEDDCRAHRLAYKTFCGKLKPNKILREKDFE